jgi:oxidase EvaA
MSKEFLFLKSAVSDETKFMTNEDIKLWARRWNERVEVSIKKVGFSSLEKWTFDNNQSLRHESGKFFSIDGISVSTNWGNKHYWEQPIINQPEIGYLGFITKEFEGVLYFLIQAKIEPGNINHVQLSPTLQATRSNYSQVHKGRKPAYLEYFQNARPESVLLDQLQSEQGGRFLKKRNRNIIIKVDDEIEVKEEFCWVTLRQLKELMKEDNLVNMDTRTVLSGISFGSYSLKKIDFYEYLIGRGAGITSKSPFLNSYLNNNHNYNSLDKVISHLTDRKSRFDLEVRKVPLVKLKDWVVSDEKIFHQDSKYFSVIPVEVTISNREVSKWCQPMVEPAQSGLCAFVCKMINGVMHFIVQLKLECGNYDVVELAPTVQCLTGNYRETGEGKLPFLDDVLRSKPGERLIDSLQSEEGGRFYREENRNMIIHLQDIETELPENYMWLTVNQMISFLRFNNFLNIQSRSLIASLTLV